MKVDDPRILESIHKNYLLGTIATKPYPIEAVKRPPKKLA